MIHLMYSEAYTAAVTMAKIDVRKIQLNKLVSQLECMRRYYTFIHEGLGKGPG